MPHLTTRGLWSRLASLWGGSRRPIPVGVVCAALLGAVGWTTFASAAPTARAAARPYFAFYDVRIGLTGEASLDIHKPCQGVPCRDAFDDAGRATYHIDITYRGAEFQLRRIPGCRIGCAPPGQAFSRGAAVVNGSFTETGDWDPCSANQPPSSCSTLFSCGGSLRATSANPKDLTWKRHNSTYSFTSDMIEEGLTSPGPGADPTDFKCDASDWFGSYSQAGYRFRVDFSLPVGKIGRKATITKIVGGPLASERPTQNDACGTTQPGAWYGGGSCTFTFGWHAVVKLRLTKLV